ncbi:MAG: hypothetical protein NTZ37_07525 [Methanoregula sp.]|nr:hypothetical protein [Methanoregula sp.]
MNNVKNTGKKSRSGRISVSKDNFIACEVYFNVWQQSEFTTLKHTRTATLQKEIRRILQKVKLLDRIKIKRKIKSALLKSSFSCNSLILCGSQDGDPLSPPEGEAAQGEHPLAPSFVKVFHQPSDDYRNIGGCPSGGGGSTMCWSSQERLLVSLQDFNRAYFF